MYFKTCEVCGVKCGRNNKEKRFFMAKFPLDEDRCRQWVKAVGKYDLAFVPIEKLHVLRHICGKHFKPKDFMKKKTKLKKCAVPSLHMTREPLSDNVLQNFPLHIAKQNATKPYNFGYCSSPNKEHNYCKSEVNKEHNYYKSSESERQHIPVTSSQTFTVVTTSTKITCNDTTATASQINEEENTEYPDISVPGQYWFTVSL